MKTEEKKEEKAGAEVTDNKQRSDKPVFAKNRRRRSDKFEKTGRPKPEFEQKIIEIRRVARVVSGGRRFSFSVALVAGNRKGSVGVGLGKSNDTPVAIEKAYRDAKKNLINISLTKDSSIPHLVKGKFSSSKVIMMPAPGRGILAGSSVRDVVELAGIKNINSKVVSGSKNKLNNAKAAIEALVQFQG